MSCTDKHSILLALNDPQVAHAFARILDGQGHSAYVAESTIEALESEPSGIVIADLEDGAIDALGLIGDLHAVGQFPRVILIAGDEATAFQYRMALRLGITDILERPLLPEALIAVVEVPRSAESLPASFGDYVDRTPDSAPYGLRIELSAHHGAAEAAARDIVGWCARCEITPSSRARIGTAVADAIQNAVDHGAQSVVVCAELDEQSMSIEVEDDGPGFDAVEELTRDRLDASSGLGRIHALAEDVCIQSVPGEGTSVQLGFRVASADFEDEGRIDLSELDFFSPDTSKELLATLSEEPDAPVILSPALAVVVGRLLMGPDPSRVLSEALWS